MDRLTSIYPFHSNLYNPDSSISANVTDIVFHLIGYNLPALKTETRVTVPANLHHCLIISISHFLVYIFTDDFLRNQVIDDILYPFLTISSDEVELSI